MIGKKGSGTGATSGSFTIAGIPNGGASAITVSYKQNNNTLYASVTGTGYSTDFTSAKGLQTTSFDIGVANNAAGTFTLTLQASGSNVRVDDISITVKTAGSGGSSYTLTFLEHAGGGTASGSPSTGTVAANATSFSFGATAPSKTGHTIEGFYTNTSASSGVKVANSSREFVASITGWTNGSSQYTKGENANLYIKWLPKTTEITLHKNNNDASGSTAGSVNYTYGENTKASYTAATRTGYHLLGYYTETSSGTKILNADGSIAGNSISVSTTTYTDGSGNWAYDGTSLTLYAQWEIDTYTVAWKVNGEPWTPYTTTGEGTDGSPSANYNNKVSTLPTAPTKDDCDGTKVFVGWTNSTYSHASAAPATLFTDQSSSPAITGNTTFHAVFANASTGDETSFSITASNISTSSYSTTETKFTKISTNDIGYKNIMYNTANSPSTGWYAQKRMQFKSDASNYGHIYNKIAISGLSKIRIYDWGSTCSSNLTVYTGTSEKATTSALSWPGSATGTESISVGASTNYTSSYYDFTVSNNHTFFYIKNGSTVAYPMKITIYYTPITYTNYNTSCVAKHTLSSAVVPTGKATVTLGATSVAEGSTTTATCADVADGYVFDHWSISGTGASLSNADGSGNSTDNPVTVTMGTADATVTAHIHRVIYLEATEFGDNSGAQFGIYSWENADGTNNWLATAFMDENDDCHYTHVYKGSIPDDHDRLIFIRNNTTPSKPDKDNNVWNKTVDITVPSDKDFFTIASGGEGNYYTGSWSVFAPYYTVEFDKNTTANGVTDPDDQCVVASSGRATAPTISDMSKDRLGYQLAGWKDGSTTWDFSTMGFTSDKTLTADWVEGATTTVALNPTWTGDGNTWDKESAIIFAHFYIDGTSQAQDVQMTKNVCDGIFTAEAPYGATHVSFARCKSGTSSLGANWNDDSNIYNYVTGLAIAANYQYSITDWGSGKVGTAQKESGAYTPTTFTISFAGNSNTGGSMDDITGIVCDADQAIPANSFEKTGYSFTNWTANVAVTVSDATVSIGSSIADEATIQDIQSNITLTAQWSIQSYTLTWDFNGGKVTTAGTGAAAGATGTRSSSVEYNADITVPVLSRNGYTFAGWDETPAANMPAANTTYTAQWTINVDQFIDDMHGTDGYTSGSPHEESGASYTMPGPLSNTTPGDDCITSHYIFVGWVESSGQNSNGTLKDSGSKIYRPGETKHATNATYYAVWAEE